MRRFAALLLLLTVLSSATPAQTDSSGLRISLLTCSPGSELYSTFGHSALRIVDTAAGTDIVYNFGVFDFSDPDFYAKFVRGKLLYFLDQEAFPYFQYAYVMEGRRITEQVLRLDDGRKRSIQAFLAENLRPENRYYKYDFLFDNCTTRLRDLILGQQSSTIRTGRVLDDTTTTFREQLHTYLYRNRQYWSALGIDILLGSRIDRPMTNEQAMFLPDFLERALDSSRDAAGNIVSEKAVILERPIIPDGDAPAIPPTTVAFSSIFAIIVLLSFNRSKVAAAILKASDAFLFFFTGALGLLLIFMWTGTDHGSCRDNLNLAWALPTHIIAAFRLRSGTRLTRRYLTLTAWISATLLAGWLFLPQDLNPALVPIVLWMGWRSYRLSR
jgi:hypothetical protein